MSTKLHEIRKLVLELNGLQSEQKVRDERAKEILRQLVRLTVEPE